MRIAWLGPTPAEQGGVPYMSGQLLTALASAGVEVDCYLTGSKDRLPAALVNVDGLRFHCRPTAWRYNRWYSRTAMTKFATGLAAGAYAQLALGRAIGEAHARRPYDLVYQFSHPELMALRPYLRALPPVVLHPEVHARGELRWHRRERAMATGGSSGRSGHALARGTLMARDQIQRRDVPLARRIIAPSRRFAHLLSEDYRVPADRFSVVPNPIDLDRFVLREGARAPGPVRLLFVSRISVRKGVEMIVALSHRLADLDGRVRLEIIGDHTLWSDYRHLLTDLHWPIAKYLGSLPGHDLPSAYRACDGLLQPSHYEPFALTVGEALASGVPVVTSDQVGASEDVDPGCCDRFPAGDLSAMETMVRGLVDRVERGDGYTIASLARSEAARLFGNEPVAAGLRSALDAASLSGD